jgi:putative inorganic carbon (hco3(-)) transporter
MNANRLNIFSHILDHLFVVITCFIIFVSTYGFFNLHLLLLVVFVIYLAVDFIKYNLHLSHLKLSGVDLVIVFIVVAEGLSYAASTYRENSFFCIADLSFLVLFFYWIKFNLKYDYQQTKIILFLSILSVLISVEGILAFLSGYFQLKSAGFDNLSDFRHIFYFGSPTGSPTGEWITIFLALIPFPLILLFTKFKKDYRQLLYLPIPVMTLLLVSLFSFSRGMYLAIVFFALFGSILFLIYKLASLKQVLLFNTIIMFSLGSIIIVSPFFKPVLTTASMFQTSSQVRSFEGRKSLWKTGIEMIKDHPLTGIGSNNFPMQYVRYKDQNDETPFVGSVFNLFLQVTIEKGVLGLIAYYFFIVAFFFVSYKKLQLLNNDWNQQIVVVLFMSTYAAILVRDLSYSSILNNRGIHLLIWFMFAYNAHIPDRKCSFKLNSTKKVIILLSILCSLILFLAIAVSSMQKEKGESLIISFIDQLNQKNYIEAERNIGTAIRVSPDNAYYWACKGLLAERALQRKFNANKFLTGNIIFTGGEMEQINRAIASFGKALVLNPVDDGYYHNLGWLYAFTQDKIKAEYYFRQAIQIDRTNAIYPISLGLIMEKNGRKDCADEEYCITLCRIPNLLDSPFFSDLKKRRPGESEKIVINAIQFLEKKFQQTNDLMIAAKLAKFYLFLGQIEKSVILLERVTKELPSLSRPWLYLGDVYQMKDKENEMIQCYQKSAFLDSTDLFPIFRLAQFYDRQNQDYNAIQYYTRLLNVSSVHYSVHASRVSRMYRSTYKDDKCVVKDDLIPDGLLSYCAPFIDYSAIYRRLADLFNKQGNNRKAAEYFKLCNEGKLLKSI